MSAADAEIDAIMRRRSLPPGACWREWKGADGWPIRTVHWPATAGRPSILFLNGRADFIEKYSEAYWHWQARGYGVMTFDWRGQGLSGRFPKGHGGYFETWLDDLEGLVALSTETFGVGFTLAGHSMGAHVALRWIAHNPANGVSRAILFSPLAGLTAHGVPQSLLYWIARGHALIGNGDEYPPLQGPYGELQRSVQRQRLLTSDPARFADEAWWIARTPELASGGATWRWIMEAITSCQILADACTPVSISIPVDIFLGEAERLVDTDAVRTIADHVPHIRLHEIASGAHELLRERDVLRELVLAGADAILETPTS